MPSISVPAAVAIGATAAGSIASSAISAGAQGAAASQQAASAQNALQYEQGVYGQSSANLQPWINNGQGASNQLAALTGTNPGGNPMTAPLTAQFQPTMAQLSATPGYQFSLNQGLQATQNSAAAQGLGTSGAALAGAANYATGLAGTTYQQQFNNYLAGNQQTYNMLQGISGTGAQAAQGLGSLGLGTASQVAGSYGQIGSAQAAGTLGTANAIGSGITGTTNNISSTALMSALYPQLLAGSSNSGTSAAFGGAIGSSTVTPGYNTLLNTYGQPSLPVYNN